MSEPTQDVLRPASTTVPMETGEAVRIVISFILIPLVIFAIPPYGFIHFLGRGVAAAVVFLFNMYCRRYENRSMFTRFELYVRMVNETIAIRDQIMEVQSQEIQALAEYFNVERISSGDVGDAPLAFIQKKPKLPS